MREGHVQLPEQRVPSRALQVRPGGFEPPTRGLEVQPDRLQRTAADGIYLQMAAFGTATDCKRTAPCGDRPVRSAYAQARLLLDVPCNGTNRWEILSSPTEEARGFPSASLKMSKVPRIFFEGALVRRLKDCPRSVTTSFGFLVFIA